MEKSLKRETKVMSFFRFRKQAGRSLFLMFQEVLRNLIWTQFWDIKVTQKSIQESISPTFYECNCANFLAPIKSLTFTSSTKKLCAKLLYKKAARKMLVKLTPGFIHKICTIKISIDKWKNVKIVSFYSHWRKKIVKNRAVRSFTFTAR
jgi:hypothetical protein